MRIIAGAHRGRRLAALGKGDAAAHLRPTTDRVRESLFNLLQKYAPFDGAAVLDLFAGTGALGFEAWSRGAGQVTFVESGRKAQALIAENMRVLGAEGQARLVRSDATRLGPGQPHDLVFLDPPYAKGLGERAVASAIAGGWLAKGALIVWEDSVSPALPAPMEQLDQRRYGDTLITIARLLQSAKSSKSEVSAR